MRFPLAGFFFLGHISGNPFLFKSNRLRTAEYFYIDLKEKDFLKDPVTLTYPCVGNLAVGVMGEGKGLE